MFTYCLPTEVLKTFCNSIQGGSYTSRHHQNLLQLLCGFSVMLCPPPGAQSKSLLGPNEGKGSKGEGSKDSWQVGPAINHRDNRGTITPAQARS